MHPSLIAFLLTGLTAACSAQVERGTLDVNPVPLYTAAPHRTDLNRLTYLGGVHLQNSDTRFGGFSALDISEDGTHMLAISDRGAWMTAQLSWPNNNHAITVSDILIAPLLSPEGHELTGDAADAEGLTSLGEGVWAVSFERDHRINTYALGEDWSGVEGSQATSFPIPTELLQLDNNGGIEALATLSNGRLIAGVEDQNGDSHALWIHEGPHWRKTELAAVQTYGLTAFDAHGGYVYALARNWQRDIGNHVRILRFPEAKLLQDRKIEPELLGIITPDMAADNFEALAVFEHGGATTLLIMSDDNFNANQRTLLLAFEVTG